MKKLNTRTLVLLGVLVVLLIYYVFDSGLFSTKEIVGTVTENIQDITESLTNRNGNQNIDNIGQVILTASITEFEWTGNWERDPFYYVSPETLRSSGKGGLMENLFGSAAGTDEEVGFNLTGISWHGNSGYAIINGSVVKPDDVIGGYRIDNIAMTYVILKQGSQTIRLSLNE